MGHTQYHPTDSDPAQTAELSHRQHCAYPPYSPMLSSAKTMQKTQP